MENKYTLKWLKNVGELFKEHKDLEALSEMKEYLELYPNDKYVKSIFGQVLYQNGHIEEAKELLQSSKNNIYNSKKTLQYMQMKKSMDAAKEFQKELTKFNTYKKEMLRKK